MHWKPLKIYTLSKIKAKKYFQKRKRAIPQISEYGSIHYCKIDCLSHILVVRRGGKSISRFARNTVDCLEAVRELKMLGIGVIFEKENLNTLTMTSEFIIALHGSFAQAESEFISKNTSWGIEKSFREGKLHNAIVGALNDFYNEGSDIIWNMQYNTVNVLSNIGDSEILRIEKRLNDIDTARNQMIGLIANGSAGEDSFDDELERLFSEESSLSAKLESLKAQSSTSAVQQEKIDILMERLAQDCGKLTDFDDVLIRKAVECIKVISKTEITIIFRGGYEVSVEVEK